MAEQAERNKNQIYHEPYRFVWYLSNPLVSSYKHPDCGELTPSSDSTRTICSCYV